MDPAVSILWCIMGMLVALQYAPSCYGLPWYKKLICATLFLIGGPFFMVGNILETILDAILPEGWDDDNEGPRGYN